MTSLPPTVRAFLAFRVLFAVRFYYPVFAILFLDLGLTVGQFALLNAVWAATIVLGEVPLGALADVIGRRPLVVAAGVLMVAEMALLAFAPPGGGALLFGLLLVNRVLSGLAEACASGADEALAYDALDASPAGRAAWPAVLERLARFQSAGFVVALLLGAPLYDGTFVRPVAALLGFEGAGVDALARRLPALLTLGMALGALAAALRMREERPPHAGAGRVARAVRQTVDAARWTLATRAVLVLILVGLAADCIVRVFLTIEAGYLRAIGIPTAAFGVIGAVFAGLGLAVAPWARRRAERCGPVANYALVGVLTLAGLTALVPAWPLWGALALVPLGAAFNLLGFFLSHDLNARVPSERRATVLSFRGLAFNVGYGVATLLYGVWSGVVAVPGDDDATLVATLPALPLAFAALAAAVVAFASRGRR